MAFYYYFLQYEIKHYNKQDLSISIRPIAFNNYKELSVKGILWGGKLIF